MAGSTMALFGSQSVEQVRSEFDKHSQFYKPRLSNILKKNQLGKIDLIN